jgi:hypothetical protein
MTGLLIKETGPIYCDCGQMISWQEAEDYGQCEDCWQLSLEEEED